MCIMKYDYIYSYPQSNSPYNLLNTNTPFSSFMSLSIYLSIV